MTKPTQEQREIKAEDMIKVIGFDLDDTLWDVMPVIKSAEKKLRNWVLSRIPEISYGLPEIKQAREKILFNDPQIGFQFTKMRKAILKEIFESHLKDPKLAEKLSQEGIDIFLKARSQVKLFPGVERTLETLANQYELGVITNGNADIRSMKISKSKWTDSDIRLLKELYGEKSVEEIASQLGKSTSAIYSKVHYLRKRGWSFNSTRR